MAMPNGVRQDAAEECAAAIPYLAAPFAGFTNGAGLTVDGDLTSSGRLL
jgi:hypothetical protein